MDYNKLVSVVMPVHNGERFLREAIESVLNQTYTNFEFLIVENCSSDSSVEIIKSYNDIRIRLIFEDECGIAQAYNRGFREAKGEYILIQDHDDVSSKIRIEALLSHSLENNLDICGSAFNVIDEYGRKKREVYPFLTKKEIKENILFNFFSIFNPTLIVKREVLINLNFFDIDLSVGTDYEFILKSFDKFVCGNTSSIILSYRLHKNSESQKNKNVNERKVKAISLVYFDIFKNDFSDPNFILARIHFFYGQYLISAKYMFVSIRANGIKFNKVKYLLLSTIFIIPVYFLRKRGLFYNKYINSISKYFISRFSN